MLHRFLPSLFWLTLSCSVLCHAQIPNSDSASHPRTPSSEIAITLERWSDYFGVAPAYKVLIYADGNVIFEGEKNVKTKGMARSSISKENLQRLIKEFEKINYFSLRDKYVGSEDGCPFMLSDASSVSTSFQFNGKRKSVYHDLGCVEDLAKGLGIFPQELFKLEQLIDDIVNSKQWIE
ncbi:MAG: DUF6438 domain-containing protein [Acidobacteria bacterium]|nr:DUF6438 domain-containing protein [Acidobacteriota bacterium]